MDSSKIFGEALSIKSPWYVDRIEFDSDQKRLDIYIDFERGASFPGSQDSSKFFKAYDTVKKTWKHLNFFEHESYLHCRTPRIKLDSTHIEQVSPPWAGEYSGFTLLFEAFLLQLCSQMPVDVVARLVGESDDKIWRILDRYIELARKEEDFSQVSIVGMDETSKRKGHNYISLFVDMKKKRTIFITEGKDSQTVKAFSEDLKAHKGSPENITEASCDMSPAFIKGVGESLPKAEITFDKFHVMKKINEAVDAVRKEEAQTQPLLKKTRYIFLKNKRNLTAPQTKTLENLQMSKLNLKSVRALQIRENFQAIYNATSEENFEELLKKWYFWATHSQLQPMIDAAKTIKAHWEGILRWKVSLINNGILEGLNSVIQAAKSKARGFRTFKNFKIIAYLITGKLNFAEINPSYQKLGP